MAEEQLLNIGGDQNDTNYRYKMPPLQCKVEGRGNGIKTVLMNVIDVAKALHTEPQYVTKFFGMEVGALSQWEKKRDVGIVHGKHDTKDFQKTLTKFISQFILCPKCKLPELTHKVNQDKQLLLAKCASCGFKGRLASTHKVKTYIVNHPPVKKKKIKRNDNVSKPKLNGNEIDNKLKGNELGGGNDELWSVDISDEAVAKRKEQELKKLASERAQKKKVTGLNDNDNKKKKGAAGILRSYIEEEDRSLLEIIDEIKRIKLSRKLDSKKTIQITFDALCCFESYNEFIKSIKNNCGIFEWFTKDNAKIFIGVMEEIIIKRNKEEFLKRTYQILYTLWENKILSAEQILEWSKTPTDQALIIEKDDADAIREKAKPFIEWLEDNDDDATEDTEESDDEQKETN